MIILNEDDIPIIKLLVKSETHDLGHMLGGKRAKDIFEYICTTIQKEGRNDFFQKGSDNTLPDYFNTSDSYKKILCSGALCDFF